MKLCIASDLHLEVGGFPQKQEQQFTKKADVLVLAGDISVAAYCSAHRTDADARKGRDHVSRLLEQANKNFKHVLMVLGNHEHYKWIFPETADTIRSVFCPPGSNVTLLDNQTKQIDDILFIGSTLWMDFRGGNKDAMYDVGRGMNDFHVIRSKRMEDITHVERQNPNYNISQGIITPEFIYEEHIRSRDFIRNQLDTNSEVKKVVITHHAPSWKSQVSNRRTGGLHGDISPGYYSDLDAMIEAQENLLLWIHGHTHDSVDYKIGKTRIVANCRGYYGHEFCANIFKPKMVKV